VANSLIAPIQSGHVDGQLTLARIDLHEYEFMDPVVVSRALRSAVVDEWLGENSDHTRALLLSIFDHMLNNIDSMVNLQVNWEILW
jgi:hypothetical protein